MGYQDWISILIVNFDSDTKPCSTYHVLLTFERPRLHTMRHRTCSLICGHSHNTPLRKAPLLCGHKSAQLPPFSQLRLSLPSPPSKYLAAHSITQNLALKSKSFPAYLT